MKCQREEVLNSFLKSKLLNEKTNLTEDEISNVNFTDDTSDMLVEALKKLTISYCQDDGETKIIQNINKVIKW